MNLSLCVHFSYDRVYLTVLEPSKTGLQLVYINSTANGIDLANPNDSHSKKGTQELEEILIDIGNIVSGIYVTLPPENVLVSQIPGKDGLSKDDVGKLINIEVKQAYPQYTNEDYTFNVVPLAPRINGSKMLMAVIIPNIIYSNAKKLLGAIKAPVIRMEISQLNAHSAFLYNYPEEKESTVAFFCVQDKFVDVSVIQNTKPAYYNLQKYNDEFDIAGICEKEFDIDRKSVV